jgi:hypothetical protein
MKRDKWSGEPYLEHQRRIIVAFQGPGRELAATVASKMTKRALYHIRLVGSDISPDAVLQQAKTLNEEWGCIILIEDIVEAMQEGAALKRHDVLQPLLRFLDGFMGITIFLLPDEPAFPGRLHPLVALHVCMNLVFIPGHPDEGFDEDHRRDFWQRLISERSMCFKPNDGTFPNDRIIIKQITVCSEKEDRESRERVASLAAWDLTEYEIRLIVDAALPRSRPADVKPDWELIDQLVKHRRLPQTEKEVIVKNDTRHTRAPSSSRR